MKIEYHPDSPKGPRGASEIDVGIEFEGAKVFRRVTFVAEDGQRVMVELNSVEANDLGLLIGTGGRSRGGKRDGILRTPGKSGKGRK